MEINAYIFVRHLHQLNIILLQKVDSRRIPQDDVESKLANLGLTELSLNSSEDNQAWVKLEIPL